MPQPLLMTLIGLGAAIGMFLLRAMTRSKEPVHEPDGVTIFAGPETACHQCVDLLADAGVAAWIETKSAGTEVHVDRADAESVPQLLAQHRTEANGEQEAPSSAAIPMAPSPFES